MTTQRLRSCTAESLLAGLGSAVVATAAVLLCCFDTLLVTCSCCMRYGRGQQQVPCCSKHRAHTALARELARVCLGAGGIYKRQGSCVQNLLACCSLSTSAQYRYGVVPAKPIYGLTAWWLTAGWYRRPCAQSVSQYGNDTNRTT